MHVLAKAKGLSGPRARRHAICLAGILALCLVFFTTVGVALLPATREVYKRQIVSNAAQALTPPLQAGDVLQQSIYVQGPLYGVNLHVATESRVLQGQLQLELLDFDTGALLLSAQTPLSALQDGAYVDFPFGGSLNAGEGSFYQLQLTALPSTPEDAPRFYKSVGTPDYYYDENLQTVQYSVLYNFFLFFNGEGQAEMLDLAYLSDVTGGFLREPYCFFAALLTVVLLAGYVLLFVLRQPLHRVFILGALGLGFVFLFLIPPRAAPDEYAHMATAYHYSNRILGTAGTDALQAQTIWMREGDAVKLHNYDTTSVGLFAYKTMAENLFAPAPAGTGGGVLVRGNAHMLPLQLAAPTLGLVLARLLGLGQTGLFLLGRLCNLLFYSFVLSRAIRRLPFAKPLLFAVGLLPMPLQLAASFSYDTYVIALGAYLLALCLDLRVNKKPVGPKQIVLLGALCLLLAPAKAAYLPLVGLLFLVKPGQYASKGLCIAARGATLAASCLLWLWYTAGSLLLVAGTTGAVAGTLAQPAFLGQAMPPQSASLATTGLGAMESAHFPHTSENSGVFTLPEAHSVYLEDYKGETNAAGDALQLYSAGYMLRHIPATVRIFLRTVWEQGPLWLLGLVGGRLGESIAVDIQLSWPLVGALLLVLGLASLPSGEDRRLLPPKHRLAFAAMALACTGAVVLAGLTWTPVNYRNIFGIQGRYLLPVLPLLLLVGRGGKLRFAKPRWRGLAFAQMALVVLCQVSAFGAVVRLA